MGCLSVLPATSIAVDTLTGLAGPPPRPGEIPRAIAKVLADAAEPMHVSDIRAAVDLLGRLGIGQRKTRSGRCATTSPMRCGFIEPPNDDDSF